MWEYSGGLLVFSHEGLQTSRVPHQHRVHKLRTTNVIERLDGGAAADPAHGLFCQCGQRGSHHLFNLQWL
jgi:hypothetical protein